MAQTEFDREDLMREATALRQRIEMSLQGETDSVVAGFRSGDHLSIYFGGNLALHFDAECRLRRAFFDGRLYRTQGRTLARLTRVRTSSETELQRHDLLPDELAELLDRIGSRLNSLEAALHAGTARVIAQIPPDADLLPRLLENVQRAAHPQIRLAPKIPARK